MAEWLKNTAGAEILAYRLQVCAEPSLAVERGGPLIGNINPAFLQTHDLGEGQWRRWKVIVNHARKLGLSVWQQDDRDYPSGYAGGTIGAREPRLARWEVMLPHSRRVNGPAALEIDLQSVLAIGQTAIAVSAFGPQSEVRDLTPNISSGRLSWQVPDGNWELFIASEWQPGISDPRAGPDHKKGQDRRYIDPLSEGEALLGIGMQHPWDWNPSKGARIRLNDRLDRCWLMLWVF